MDKEFQELQEYIDIIITTSKLLNYHMSYTGNETMTFFDPNSSSIRGTIRFFKSYDGRIVLVTKFSKQSQHLTFKSHQEKIDSLIEIIQNL